MHLPREGRRVRQEDRCPADLLRRRVHVRLGEAPPAVPGSTPSGLMQATSTPATATVAAIKAHSGPQRPTAAHLCRTLGRR